MTATTTSTLKETSSMTATSLITDNGRRVHVTDYGTCYGFRCGDRSISATIDRSGHIRLAAGPVDSPVDDRTFRVPMHDRDVDQAFGWAAVALEAGLTARDFNRVGLATDWSRWVSRRRHDVRNGRIFG